MKEGIGGIAIAIRIAMDGFIGLSSRPVGDSHQHSLQQQQGGNFLTHFTAVVATRCIPSVTPLFADASEVISQDQIIPHY